MLIQEIRCMSPIKGHASPRPEVSIREFEPGDEADFRNLNEEWITRYFRIEAKDQETLANPQAKILDPGGRIFLAIADGRAVGCCALLHTGEAEFEVAKMAVTPACQGAGVGRKLLRTAIEAARTAGTRRLFLETNHQLGPAIQLYRSSGFQPIPESRLEPSPYARADVFMELFLA